MVAVIPDHDFDKEAFQLPFIIRLQRTDAAIASNQAPALLRGQLQQSSGQIMEVEAVAAEAEINRPGLASANTTFPPCKSPWIRP